MKPLKGVVPVSELAAAWGVSQKAAKRRVLGLDKTYPGLLVRFTVGGMWFADATLLKRHVPGLSLEEGTDPLDRVANTVARLEQLLADMHGAVTGD